VQGVLELVREGIPFAFAIMEDYTRSGYRRHSCLRPVRNDVVLRKTSIFGHDAMSFLTDQDVYPPPHAS